MTLNEAKEIVGLLQFNYPDNFRSYTDDALITYVRLWHSFFEADSFALVAAAVKAYITTSTERFMPNVGQIKEQIRKLTSPEGMSETKAWSLVTAALRNSAYGWREEWAKLPEAVQKAVGNENTLREWAMIDSEELNTVIASNFMRSYRTIQKREEEWAKLPAGFREEMKRLSGKIFAPLELGDGN
jgi:hypothetical protein